MKTIKHYKEEQQKNNISFLIRGRIYCFLNFLEVLAGILTVGTETLKKGWIGIVLLSVLMFAFTASGNQENVSESSERNQTNMTQFKKYQELSGR